MMWKRRERGEETSGKTMKGESPPSGKDPWTETKRVYSLVTRNEPSPLLSIRSLEGYGGGLSESQSPKAFMFSESVSLWGSYAKTSPGCKRDGGEEREFPTEQGSETIYAGCMYICFSHAKGEKKRKNNLLRNTRLAVDHNRSALRKRKVGVNHPHSSLIECGCSYTYTHREKARKRAPSPLPLISSEDGERVCGPSGRGGREGIKRRKDGSNPIDFVARLSLLFLLAHQHA
ncbi:hypothetical protein IE53DRAFT_87278 [Violaceomyces palustris]|uniref:Uncharacterized protein n=1 Tax=Violaceomyces palustris TaxID=1673888 RepID=A0ACD0NXZ9_9BASI|nr:hypothetical protein IE53DRAFT_87278 [Violaceomyces palustris]